MAGRFGDRTGGIAGLRQLIARHSEAVEYELILLGLRLDWLGTERLSWRDLLVIVRQAKTGGPLDRAERGADALWGIREQLLAGIFDKLAIANWQRGAGKERDRPKPLPRPGVTDETTKQYGKGALPLDEMAAWLGWNAPDSLDESKVLIDTEHAMGIDNN